MAKLHRTDLPYDPMPRAVAQDKTMSLAALGIYAWARSLPDGAELSVEEVVKQDRGVGMPTARKAVKELRDRGLWHTFTIRTRDPEKPLVSLVIVAPEPWTTERARTTLNEVDGRIVDNPPPPKLRDVSAGQPDREVSDDQAPDDRGADDRRPTDPSYENRELITTSPTLRAAEGARCTAGHKRPVRGCCARADRKQAEIRSTTAEREARRNWPRWCGEILCNNETRIRYDTNDKCPDCHPSSVGFTNEPSRAAVAAAVAAMAERRALPR